MSLKKLQSDYPKEIVPTHYEIRSQRYPYLITTRTGDVIGTGEPTTVVHGVHDNLLDALRQQADIELKREANDAGYVVPILTPEQQDQYVPAYGPGLKLQHPHKPQIYAVYPDKSHINIDFPSDTYSPTGQHIESFLFNENPDDVAHMAEYNAYSQRNSKHRNIIDTLSKIGRNLYLLHHLATNAKMLRDKSLIEHDLTSALIAADALQDELGGNFEHSANQIRQLINGKDQANYKQSTQPLYYKNLNKTLKNTK